MPTADVIDLVYNYPAPGPRGRELIQDLAATLLSDAEGATRYLPVDGLPEHRRLCAEWLSRADAVIAPERVAFGVSGHQLLAAILLSSSPAGACIACDPITYNGWLNLVRHTGRKALAVAGDEHGMSPEALDDAASREPIWGVFLMPSLHNPCSTIMPIARREAIADVCRRRGLFVIDDDAYRFLNADAGPSFAHLIPERAFWLQSLSKPLFASIKTAFLVSPLDAVARVRDALRVTGHQPSALTLPWVLSLVASGRLDGLIVEKRAEARRRQALVGPALAGLTTHSTPDAFHVWVELPKGWTADSATAALLAEGAAVVSGAAYSTTGAETSAIRIALAGEVERECVAEGLRRVGVVLRSKP